MLDNPINPIRRTLSAYERRAARPIFEKTREVVISLREQGIPVVIGWFLMGLVFPFHLLRPLLAGRRRRFRKAWRSLMEQASSEWDAGRPSQGYAVLRDALGKVENVFPRSVQIPPFGPLGGPDHLMQLREAVYQCAVQLEDWEGALAVVETVSAANVAEWNERKRLVLQRLAAREC